MTIDIKNKGGLNLNNLRDFVDKSARLPGYIPVRLADDNNIIPITQIIGNEEDINIFI